MRKIKSLLVTSIMALMVCNAFSASPWFTGPLLAPAGKTIPAGHFNIETYGFFTKNIGVYNRHWKLVHTGSSDSTVLNPLLSYGLADRVDVQFSLPYIINHSFEATGKHIGDTSALLGLQLWEQKESRWSPNIRFTIQEIIPTGRFENLNPNSNGTDGTGIGSYQTVLGLNFQHLLPLGAHYLRTRLSLGYLHAQPVTVHGLNSFGGNAFTKGSVTPGNMSTVDLAGEFTITQNWVAVMEGYYFNRDRTTFRGYTGVNSKGLPLIIGHNLMAEISLAPAIEYNFSPNFGIIAGVWYSVRGKDAADFKSTVIAFNAYW